VATVVEGVGGLHQPLPKTPPRGFRLWRHDFNNTEAPQHGQNRNVIRPGQDPVAKNTFTIFFVASEQIER
jgi:hypothetical protein